jgi:hypothetical protein
MNQFEPLGSEARWRIIYALIQRKEVDQVITYAEMGDALELHPKDDRHTIQMAMRRAAVESEREDKRALEVVRNQGYRIVHAEEHLRLARGQQTKAGRALIRGQSKVENVDLNGMDPNIRKAFDVMATAFSMQADMMRRLSGRQADLEKVVNEVQKRGDERGKRTEAEVAELRARLELLETKRKDATSPD